jgi:hypothetical protein
MRSTLVLAGKDTHLLLSAFKGVRKLARWLILLVGAEGFEPPTLCSQSRCATRLRYAPIPGLYRNRRRQAWWPSHSRHQRMRKIGARKMAVKTIAIRAK